MGGISSRRRAGGGGLPTRNDVKAIIDFELKKKQYQHQISESGIKPGDRPTPGQTPVNHNAFFAAVCGLVRARTPPRIHAYSAGQHVFTY